MSESLTKEAGRLQIFGREDFTVYEDDVKQPISTFAPTVTPFSVVMILDMSGSTLGFQRNHPPIGIPIY